MVEKNVCTVTVVSDAYHIACEQALYLGLPRGGLNFTGSLKFDRSLSIKPRKQLEINMADRHFGGCEEISGHSKRSVPTGPRSMFCIRPLSTRVFFSRASDGERLQADRIEIHQSQSADSKTKRRLEGHTGGCNWWISIWSDGNFGNVLGTMSSLVEMFVKHITRLRSGEDTDVGRQHFDLSSPQALVSLLSLYKAHATNEYSWCNVLVSVHKRYKLGPIFTLLCEDNTDRAFMLWRWKQIFCSSLTGLASVLNFKGTTAESTEILYRGKKSISSSPDFLFRSKFRHYFDTFLPPGTRFSTFLHSPRNWLMHVIFSQWDFASPRRSRNENSSVRRQSSPQLAPAPILSRLAPKINLAWDPNRELARRLRITWN